MAFELLGSDMLIFLVIMIVFIIVAYKIVKIAAKAAIIGLVAALFPLFSNYFLGTTMAIDIYTIIWFAVTGVALYLLYCCAGIIWKFLKILTAPLRAIFGGKKEKK
jgi:hypothetical protein